ncbi:MAG: transcriptional repressor [Magnetovibrio sp.]|nr:transcriptional repressor [Magnetovibrio sp.]
MESRLEKRVSNTGLRLTAQRRIIARAICLIEDHPSVDEIHRKALETNPNISIATVYRTLRLFEELGLLDKHEFNQSRARYEEATENHHDHLIDIETGKTIEFHDKEIEALQKEIANENGLRLIGHRMELYVRPLGS